MWIKQHRDGQEKEQQFHRVPQSMPGKLQRVRIQAQEPGQDNPVVQFNNIKFIRNP